MFETLGTLIVILATGLVLPTVFAARVPHWREDRTSAGPILAASCTVIDFVLLAGSESDLGASLQKVLVSEILLGIWVNTG